MSEFPIVSSTGWPRTRNFTGLNGSILPRPHSGLVYIHASAACRSSSALRVRGMMTNR
jgi:hypothetical protein